MIETTFEFVADWTVRWTLFALFAGMMLWGIRKKNSHLQLMLWTVVLVSGFLIPFSQLIFPATQIPLLQSSANYFSGDAPLPISGVLSGGELNASQTSAPLWMQVVVIVWGLVAAALFLRLLTGFLLTRMLFKSAQLIQQNVYESNLIQVPLTAGLVHPRILLPLDWRSWDENRFSAVLAHEGAHVDRRDPLLMFAASLFRSVFFFHPFAWWLRTELTRLAEDASDDVAMAVTGNRIGYAETLLSFMQRSQTGRVEWQGVAMATRQTRAQRMDRILDSDRPLSQSLSLRAFCSLLAIALPLIYITATSEVVEAQNSQELNQPAPLPTGDRYSKWLSQDVIYIIKDEEKAAFNRLQTSAEKDQFIEQFWEHRDPTPGTARNEFKEEHYRRISYADRFSFGTVDGWRSNRGRIYIVYGPPDVIESHPQGSTYKRPAEQGGGQTVTHPWEKWRYKWIEGVGAEIFFEFVDSTHDGQYRMISAP